MTSRKAARYLLAIFIIFTLNFIIPRAMPGDPMTNIFGEDAIISESSMAELKGEMGLDKPIFLQYVDYWARILQLDLGYSYHFHSRVSDLIMSKMIWTLILVAPSIVLGGIAGTVLGAIAGWRREDTKNSALTAIVLIIYSTPPYFLSILVLYLFSFKLGIFPLKGFYLSLSLRDVAYHMALPICIMSLFSASRNYTIMRGSVIQEKRMLYVAYARAKGLFGDEILFRHVFKNALLPIITVLALDFGFILSGALFIEIVFSLNGMGNLIYDAILSRDYPVLQGAFLLITLMIVSANLIADILYGILDPRVRWQ